MADGYEKNLARLTELEVDLSTACHALERSQSDNIALRELYTDLAAAYKRLQDQHERVRTHLHQEQEMSEALQNDHEQQVAAWQSQLAAKVREAEELQHGHVAPRKVEAIRMAVAEEVQGHYSQRIRDLEHGLAAERRGVGELERQLQQQRGEFKHREDELMQDLQEQERLAQQREQALERQIADLKAQARKHADADIAAARTRGKVQELEAKLSDLHQALKEKDEQGDSERKKQTEEVRGHIEELSGCRRKVLELQARLDQEERKGTRLAGECEAAHREHAQAVAQLGQAEAKAAAVAALPPAEAERFRAELDKARADRDKAANALKAAHDQRDAALEECRRAEAQLRDANEGQTEREKATRSEHEEAERRLKAEVDRLKTQVDAAEKEAETAKRSAREREQGLRQQLDAADSQKEREAEELWQCKVAQEDATRRFQEAQRAQQQREGQWQGKEREYQAKVDALEKIPQRMERELKEAKEAAEAARGELKQKGQSVDVLQVEIRELSSRLDMERSRHAKESEEEHQAAEKAEQQRHAVVVQRMSDESKRQLHKLQAASKKAIKAATKKRHDLKLKVQDLAKRVIQLQQEKAAAIRLCEENKHTYEQRMAEMGTPRLYAGEATQFRRERTAVAERLEQHAESLRSPAKG